MASQPKRRYQNVSYSKWAEPSLSTLKPKAGHRSSGDDPESFVFQFAVPGLTEQQPFAYSRKIVPIPVSEKEAEIEAENAGESSGDDASDVADETVEGSVEDVDADEKPPVDATAESEDKDEATEPTEKELDGKDTEQAPSEESSPTKDDTKKPHSSNEQLSQDSEFISAADKEPQLQPSVPDDGANNLEKAPDTPAEAIDQEESARSVMIPAEKAPPDMPKIVEAKIPAPDPPSDDADLGANVAGEAKPENGASKNKATEIAIAPTEEAANVALEGAESSDNSPKSPKKISFAPDVGEAKSRRSRRGHRSHASGSKPSKPKVKREARLKEIRENSKRESEAQPETVEEEDATIPVAEVASEEFTPGATEQPGPAVAGDESNEQVTTQAIDSWGNEMGKDSEATVVEADPSSGNGNAVEDAAVDEGGVDESTTDVQEPPSQNGDTKTGLSETKREGITLEQPDDVHEEDVVAEESKAMAEDGKADERASNEVSVPGAFPTTVQNDTKPEVFDSEDPLKVECSYEEDTESSTPESSIAEKAPPEDQSPRSEDGAAESAETDETSETLVPGTDEKVEVAKPENEESVKDITLKNSSSLKMEDEADFKSGDASLSETPGGDDADTEMPADELEVKEREASGIPKHSVDPLDIITNGQGPMTLEDSKEAHSTPDKGLGDTSEHEADESTDQPAATAEKSVVAESSVDEAENSAVETIAAESTANSMEKPPPSPTLSKRSMHSEKEHHGTDHWTQHHVRAAKEKDSSRRNEHVPKSPQKSTSGRRGYVRPHRQSFGESDDRTVAWAKQKRHDATIAAEEEEKRARKESKNAAKIKAELKKADEAEERRLAQARRRRERREEIDRLLQGSQTRGTKAKEPSQRAPVGAEVVLEADHGALRRHRRRRESSGSHSIEVPEDRGVKRKPEDAEGTHRHSHHHRRHHRRERSEQAPEEAGVATSPQEAQPRPMESSKSEGERNATRSRRRRRSNDDDKRKAQRRKSADAPVRSLWQGLRKVLAAT